MPPDDPLTRRRLGAPSLLELKIFSGKGDRVTERDKSAHRAKYAREIRARDDVRATVARAKLDQARRAALNRELVLVDVPAAAQQSAEAALHLTGSLRARIRAIARAMMREAMLLADGDHAQAARLVGLDEATFTKRWNALVRALLRASAAPGGEG